MGTFILKPISDLDLSQQGDWTKKHNNRTFATYFATVDDDRAYILAASNSSISSGIVGLGMAYDNATYTLPEYFTIQDIRMVGLMTATGDALVSNSAKIKGTLQIADNNYNFDYITFASNVENVNYLKSVSNLDTTHIFNAEDFNSDNLRFDFYGQAQTSNQKKAESRNRLEIDSMNLEVDYTEVELSKTLYIKSNNTWKQCTPYKKINGVWVQQDASFLGSSNIAQLYYKGG